MKLYNNFFTIIEQNGNDFLIKLNVNHCIYNAHFPENPITPGVLLIQITCELLEMLTNCKLFLQKIRNVKFTAVVNPELTDNIHFVFSAPEETAAHCNAAVEIRNENTVFAKMNANFLKII
ncbi:MAG: hypothetical protein LBS01_00775 [Prevotellaceae bacterium]|jgi:3-hydroxyacyl-[acyl-carrier-protein] dehydratase|nr:hypothetical protein [Prevotellaceae bacterium]